MAEPTIFDVRMRTEFWRQYRAQPPAAPIDAAIMDVASTAALERYPFVSPPARLQEWAGARKFVAIDPNNIYTVRNKSWESGFAIPNELVEDAQAGEYDMKATQLADRSKEFRRNLVLKTLSVGKTETAFDGAAFFANAHTIGVGDNILSEAQGDFAVADASGDEAIVFLVTDDSMKPLLYQLHNGYPKLDSNSGTKQSSEEKETRWWVDVRANAAFGYWWEALLVTMGGVPTLTEMLTILDGVDARFKAFELPKARASDDADFPHEQRTFSSANLVAISSAGVFQRLKRALMSEKIDNTDNIYRGYAAPFQSNFLNSIADA